MTGDTDGWVTVIVAKESKQLGPRQKGFPFTWELDSKP